MLNRIIPLLLLIGFMVTAVALRAQQKPNIIFILTDDQRWDALGAAGNTIIRTPNLDKLASNGVLFKNAYVTTSICCVSRASILSGQYESRHKINDFKTNFSEQALSQTYPMLLKNAGYKIGFIGKYGVGDHPPAASFDFWTCTPKTQPDYIMQSAGGNTIHNTDSVANDISLFLRRFGKQGPFCLSVGFKAPHEQDGNPPRFLTQSRFDSFYHNTRIPEPETAAPRYWNSFPAFFRTDENIARKRWTPLFSNDSAYQETVKRYYRLITGVDEVVGKMISELKEMGLDKNTVIIFMGDNGFYLGEHGLEGKWYGHEESIRVPLIYYDPRMTAPGKGKRSNKMVLNIDIAPTILSLAGVSIPKQMQGKHLASFLQNTVPERTEFFYEHHYQKAPALPQTEGVVTGSLKYLKYIEFGYEELYDTSTDSHEKVNLAADKKHAGELAAMRKKYLVWKKAVK